MNDKNMKAESGDNSSIYQAGRDLIVSGWSYSEVRDIALDVYKSNALQFKIEAAEIASSRAEEITEKFLNKLMLTSPSLLESFKQPDLQDNLFNVQKEYAKSGDKDLGELLIDILIERVNSPTRDLKQVVLDEALKTAPKLTVPHFDILALSFSLLRTKSTLVSLDALERYIIKEVGDLCESISLESSFYDYLEYLGCGHMRTAAFENPAKILKDTYSGLFKKGFTMEAFEHANVAPQSHMEYHKTLIIPCLHNPALFQFNAADEGILDKALQLRSLESDWSLNGFNNLKELSQISAMDLSDVRQYLVNIDSRTSRLFDNWESSRLNRFELTSVGVAIAHAHCKHKGYKLSDLSIWIC